MGSFGDNARNRRPRLSAREGFDEEPVEKWRRPGSAAGGQCTLTGDSSFWRATMNACARSGTSASTAPFSAWIA